MELSLYIYIYKTRRLVTNDHLTAMNEIAGRFEYQLQIMQLSEPTKSRVVHKN